MKSSDPNHSIQFDPSHEFEEVNPPDMVSGQDPLTSLLAEEDGIEVDEERLYTDEFIRANENASRSLFLGFLGVALLATAMFAWFVLSQDQEEPRQTSPSPVVVPKSPPETIPDLRLDAVPVEPSSSQTAPNDPTSDPPLVFPATPVAPDNSPQNSAGESERDSVSPATSEGVVPPPPPINP